MSEQQRNQDCEEEKIEGNTNSRIHHFLAESNGPNFTRVQHEQHEDVEPSPFFSWTLVRMING